LSDRTYSLWGQVASRLDEFLNPLYRQDAYSDLLAPNLAPPNIHFWRGLYCRFESGVHPRESVADVLLATRDHSASMELHIAHLQKRITSLKVRQLYLHSTANLCSMASWNFNFKLALALYLLKVK